MSRKALVAIQLPADPTQPLEAATKQYADGLVVVATADPIGTTPQTELWFDSDAPGPVTAGVGLPSAGTTGQVLVKQSATDYDSTWQSIGAWQNWSPVITQGGAALGATVQYARYTMIGKTVIGSMVVSMTATGTAGQQLVCTVPVAAVLGSGLPSIGNGFIWRVTPNLTYVLHVRLNDANTVIFVADGGQGGNWGATPSSALTSGDPFRFTFAYEAV